MRNIDDFLVSEQNECSGYCWVHIPATVDSLAAHRRAVQERFPTDPLHSWTSDSAKAYRQVPLCPGQLHLSVVAQWHPEMEQVVYTIPFAQLFGGRTPPLHFARHPAWFTFFLSAAIALPTHHCVDDVVGVDRVSTATETWKCWRRIAEATGWDVPDEKSPAPSAATVALGAMLDHTPTPNASSNIWVTEERSEAITMDLRSCWQRKTLGSGEASKLWGRLQSLSSQLNARFGRAKLGPIKRRQYERTAAWSRQLDYAVQLWIAALQDIRPRPVPVALSLPPTVITYSDGEGKDAGVGISIYKQGSRPRAAYMQIPEPLRLLWKTQRESTAKNGYL